MVNPSLGDICSIFHSDPTVATSGSVLTPGPAGNLLFRTYVSAMAQFSMELRELKAVRALSTLSSVSETQLNTQAIMHEFSADSEVTFRKVLVSAEILTTRPGIDPFEDTRPMDTSSDRSSWQLSPLTSVSPYIIAPRIPHDPATTSASSNLSQHTGTAHHHTGTP